MYSPGRMCSCAALRFLYAEKATIVEATASAYDSRSVSDSGCYEDGCVPDLVKVSKLQAKPKPYLSFTDVSRR